MTWTVDDQQPGYPPIEPFVPATAPTGISPWPPTPQGTLVVASDPVWGVGEFIFAKANGTIRNFGLCVLTQNWNATSRQYDWNATEIANTAGQGRPVYVCMSEQANGTANQALTVGQYGWFMDAGIVPVNGTATVAQATVFGITAAGQVGANSAGKQILNATIATPATNTVVKSVAGGGAQGANTSGASLIQVNNVDGLFVGGYLSGTGVGTNAIIQAIDRIGMVLTVSVVNSAQVTGNVTQTANNATIFYNVAVLDRAFCQGATT